MPFSCCEGGVPVGGSFKTVLHGYREKHGCGEDAKPHNSRKRSLKNMNCSAMKLWMKLQGGNAGVCRRLGKGWKSAQLKWGAGHCALRPWESCPGCPHRKDLPYSSTRSRIVLLPNSPKMRHTGAPKSQEKKPHCEAFRGRAACGQPPPPRAPACFRLQPRWGFTAPELACGKQDRCLLAAFNPAPLARSSRRRDKMCLGARDVTPSVESGSILSFCHK
ncbi:uncharacterized protein LOC118162440 [Oxyura jamaicensis]|uniref:uncharacterized protein LOC118162440 n=1 Tax=Oxyura jamaicensis TaxID=8884 RepID=UPI0015A62731|nr:uncharacterized protein LOC118162440 [Oxyura jamaicensis]